MPGASRWAQEGYDFTVSQHKAVCLGKTAVFRMEVEAQLFPRCSAKRRTFNCYGEVKYKVSVKYVPICVTSIFSYYELKAFSVGTFRREDNT